MMGRSAKFVAISSVADNKVKTSALLCGITAIFGISAPRSCILRSRYTISDWEGVLSKSWFEATTFTPYAWAAEITSLTYASPQKASTSTKSTKPVAAMFLFKAT